MVIVMQLIFTEQSLAGCSIMAVLVSIQVGTYFKVDLRLNIGAMHEKDISIHLLIMM